MRSGLLPLAGWGLGLLALTLLGVLAFGLELLPAALLGGAGAAILLTGLGAVAAEHLAPRHRTHDEPQLLLSGSAATAVLAVGVAIALVGLVSAGRGYFWPGVGLSVLGAGGIGREVLAGRRLLADTERVSR